MVTLGFPGSDQADLPLLERKPLDQPHTSASSGFLFFFRVFRLDLARVAEVGKLSASAKNAFNSFLGRTFGNSRQKTMFFRLLPKLQQKGSFYLVLLSFYLVLPSFY